MRVKPSDRVGTVQEYFFSKKLKEIAKMNQTGKPVINLGIGSPDLPPHPAVVETLAREASKPTNHGYQSYVGIPEFRAAYAGFYQENFGVALDPNTEVLPLIGSKEGIMHLSMAFLNPEDEVLIPNPGYPAYEAASKLAGAKLLKYNLTAANDWQPNFEELEKLRSPKTKIMWVNYPHMPTGAKANKAVFEQLIAFGIKHNILIINDNPYAFILNDAPLSILSIEGSKETALELNSLSKSHNMAGWRMGMLAGKASYLEAALKFKSNMDSGMFKPLQLAAIEALKLSKDWFASLNEQYAARKKLATNLLESLGCEIEHDRVGMFVWGKIPATATDGFELSDAILYKSRVFITPGGIFGSNGDGYIRISLCSPIDKLQEAQMAIDQQFNSVTI